MRLTSCVVTFVSLVTGALIALASPPTSAPTTAQTGNDATLCHGIVHYTVPAGWKLRGKAADDLSAHYNSPNGKSILSVVVVPLKQRISDAMIEQIAPSLTKKILADAQKDGAEVLTAPHEEHDDRFAVKLLDRTRKDGHTIDRLHLYRREASMLLSVVCRVTAETHELAEPVHKVAEQLLMDVTLESLNESSTRPTTKPATSAKPAADATGPTVLVKARLRILTPPPGWRVQKPDAATGVVASYHERGGENGLIVVSVRPIPAEAKKDPKIRDILIDEMVSGEQASMQIPGAKEKDKPHAVTDARFLRKTARTYDVEAAGYTVVSRQIVVGNSLVSVASLAPDERAAEIDAMADTVATSAKPLGR